MSELASSPLAQPVLRWCWPVRVPTRPADCLAAAALSRDGQVMGWLATWPSGRKPVAEAVRADARIVDPAGAEAAVSLVLLPRDRSPLFDDPAVSGALRAVLSGLPLTQSARSSATHRISQEH